MTTLIKHYARKVCKKTGKQHWQEIIKDKALKTEKKIFVVDSIDSDLLWFTTSDVVAGGATCYIMQITHSFIGQKLFQCHDARNAFNAFYAQFYPADDEYLCLTFDADEIGAVKWNQHKGPWISGCSRRNRYVKSIDARSNLNGDDTRDYWITEHDVSIEDAIDCDIVEYNPLKCLNQLGFSDYYDFYVWYDANREKAIRNGMEEGNAEFDGYIGKLIMKRTSLTQHKAAA